MLKKICCLFSCLFSINICASKAEENNTLDKLNNILNSEKLDNFSFEFKTKKIIASDKFVNEDIKIYGTGIDFSYTYHKNNEVVLGLYKGITSDNINYQNQTENVELQNQFSVYNKYNHKLNEKLNLYINTGINYLWFKTNLNKECKELSPLIGIGLNYEINNKFDISLGYDKLFQDSEYSVSSVNFGIKYRF